MHYADNSKQYNSGNLKTVRKNLFEGLSVKNSIPEGDERMTCLEFTPNATRKLAYPGLLELPFQGGRKQQQNP